MGIGSRLRLLCVMMTLVLALVLVACGGSDTESATPSGATSEPAATGGSGTTAGSVEYNAIPEVAGYEIVDQSARGSELLVTYGGNVSLKQAEEDLRAWAEANGWTALEVDWPNIAYAFQKPGRAYPLKIVAAAEGPGSGRSHKYQTEILVMVPALGEKRGAW